MHKHIVLVFIFIFVFIQGQTTIAVLDFEARNLSSDEVATLTDRFRDELSISGRYIVVERSKMEEVLKEQGFQQSMCATNECVVELGQMIGVEQMIAGSISLLGGIYSVSARVIDIQSGRIIKVSAYDHQGSLGDLLRFGMGDIVEDIITERKNRYTTGSRRESLQIKGRLGISGGFANGMLEMPETSLESISDKGFNGSILYNIKFGRLFYIQPGIRYAQFSGGYKEIFGGGDYANKIKEFNYLEIPLDLGLNFRNLFSIYTGAYAGFKLKGNENYDEKRYGKTYKTSYKVDDSSGMSYGVHFGAGLNIWHLFIDVNYNYGLGSLLETSDLYKRQTTISIGYFLN